MPLLRPKTSHQRSSALGRGTFECLKKKPTTPTSLDKPYCDYQSKGLGKLHQLKANKVNAETDKKLAQKKRRTRDQKQNKPDAKKPISTDLTSRQIIYDILVAVDEGLILIRRWPFINLFQNLMTATAALLGFLLQTAFAIVANLKGAGAAGGATPFGAQAMPI